VAGVAGGGDDRGRFRTGGCACELSAGVAIGAAPSSVGGALLAPEGLCVGQSARHVVESGVLVRGACPTVEGDVEVGGRMVTPARSRRRFVSASMSVTVSWPVGPIVAARETERGSRAPRTARARVPRLFRRHNPTPSDASVEISPGGAR
jgi:hypothetical protein